MRSTRGSRSGSLSSKLGEYGVEEVGASVAGSNGVVGEYPSNALRLMPLVHSLPSHQVDVVRAIVVGNLLTLTVIQVWIFNYRLFESYFFEIAYSIFFSEALWEPRHFLVCLLGELERDLEEDSTTPRKFLNKLDIIPRLVSLYLSSLIVLFTACLIEVLPLDLATSWLRASTIALSGLVFVPLLVVYALDARIPLVFRFVNNFIVSKETAVPVLFLAVVLSGLFLIINIFVRASIAEAITGIDGVGAYFDRSLDQNPDMRESMGKALLTLRGAVTNASLDYERETNGTIWGPVVSRIVTSFLPPSSSENGDRGLVSFAWLWQEGGNGTSITFEEVLDMGRQIFLRYYAEMGEGNTAAFTVLTNLMASGHHQSAAKVLEALLATLSYIVTILGVLSDYFTRIAIFSSLFLFLFTSQKSLSQTIFDRVGLIFPDSAHDLHDFQVSLNSTFRAVFALPIVMALTNGALSFVFWNILGLFERHICPIHGIYFASTLAALVTFVPVISKALPPIPWCISLWIAGAHPALALALWLVLYSLMGAADDYVIAFFRTVSSQQVGLGGPSLVHEDEDSAADENKKSDFLTSLAFFLGITAFGVHGVVVGPMFVSFLKATFTFVVR